MYVYTCIYVHSCRYMYISIHVRIYVHIHTYTDISKSRSGGVFEGPRAAGWIPTDQICCNGPRDWSVVRESCIGDLRAEREGRFRGPGRAPWGGVRQIGSAKHLPRAGKSKCSDALGCLSVARRLPPRETVFR
jgi:hypothetical protein